MTCKDCIGYDFCSDYEKYSEADIREFIDEGDVRDLCSYFKNKKDFVEVVRCKDCKWAEQVMIGQCVNWICKCPWMFERYVRDGFCNYGERRDT